MQGISRLAENRLASQEGFCSTEYVNNIMEEASPSQLASSIVLLHLRICISNGATETYSGKVNKRTYGIQMLGLFGFK